MIAGYEGMADGDGLIMANFRADRARQIMTALLDPAFDGFARARYVRFAAASGMSSYSESLDRLAETMFPPQQVADGLGAVVSRAGLRQLRVAETEKYAHVTFFLNGGEEREMPGEERVLVPSPKVATYDLQPEMSAPEVTDRVIEAVAGGRFDLIVVNYANTDMVGHTGDLNAAMAAVAAWTDASATSRARLRLPTARSSSPPITAMPSRCGAQTARRLTRRTRMVPSPPFSREHPASRSATARWPTWRRPSST